MADGTDSELTLGSARGRIALVATVGASGMAMLDATVVNVALPHIGSDFHASVSDLQWVLTGYLLALASLILLGGALGDRFGRRRVFVIGTAWFAVASMMCGVAPNIETLVIARMLQGIGGALLTPGSLAILQASFRERDRAAAVGAWSGLGGVDRPLPSLSAHGSRSPKRGTRTRRVVSTSSVCSLLWPRSRRVRGRSPKPARAAGPTPRSSGRVRSPSWRSSGSCFE